MKLWIKISLISIIMVALAMGVSSMIVLLSSGKSSLEMAVDKTLTDQRLRAASWATAMENESDANFSSVARRSLARYLIDKFADENTILISGEDFIYNATNIEPTDYLEVYGTSQRYVITDIGEAEMLITGSVVSVDKTDYSLYVLEDISYVYDGIEQMSYRFSLINLAVIIVTGAMVFVLVRFVLRPIETLKKNTGLIAAGIYNKRVDKKEDDEIGELAEHFNSMAQAVETRIKELKDEADRRMLFMSALTHELKTPMTAISGNAQTLLLTKMDEEEREEALITINSECLRIERLSQKLMQLIGLHQNESIEMERADVGELLGRVAKISAEQIKQRGLVLEVKNSMDSAVFDMDLMSELLLNLVDNAGKASKPGNVIELAAQRNVFYVKDYGIGIAKEEIEKICQPFYMTDKSRNRKNASIGLGLALVAEIAKLHGAKLEIDSKPGKGTSVKVVLENEEN